LILGRLVQGLGLCERNRNARLGNVYDEHRDDGVKDGKDDIDTGAFDGQDNLRIFFSAPWDWKRSSESERAPKPTLKREIK
jgi:hypothetical protein